MFVERYGEFTIYEGKKYYVFPTPERLAQISIDELKEIQFSKQKAEYLITISRAFLNGSLSKKLLQNLPTAESRIKQLTSIRGIGQWTVNYALMKSLKEPTCIPHGDAGLLNALVNHKIIKAKDDKIAIEQFFSSFSGWESYLVFYLWRTLSQPSQ